MFRPKFSRGSSITLRFRYCRPTDRKYAIVYNQQSAECLSAPMNLRRILLLRILLLLPPADHPQERCFHPLTRRPIRHFAVSGFGSPWRVLVHRCRKGGGERDDLADVSVPETMGDARMRCADFLVAEMSREDRTPHELNALCFIPRHSLP
jgi:hypothetical protein